MRMQEIKISFVHNPCWSRSSCFLVCKTFINHTLQEPTPRLNVETCHLWEYCREIRLHDKTLWRRPDQPMWSKTKTKNKAFKSR
jgi:hypothetical protein